MKQYFKAHFAYKILIVTILLLSATSYFWADNIKAVANDDIISPESSPNSNYVGQNITINGQEKSIALASDFDSVATATYGGVTIRKVGPFAYLSGQPTNATGSEHSLGALTPGYNGFAGAYSVFPTFSHGNSNIGIIFINGNNGGSTNTIRARHSGSDANARATGVWLTGTDSSWDNYYKLNLNGTSKWVLNGDGANYADTHWSNGTGYQKWGNMVIYNYWGTAPASGYVTIPGLPDCSGCSNGDRWAGLAFGESSKASYAVAMQTGGVYVWSGDGASHDNVMVHGAYLTSPTLGNWYSKRDLTIGNTKKSVMALDDGTSVTYGPTAYTRLSKDEHIWKFGKMVFYTSMSKGFGNNGLSGTSYFTIPSAYTPVRYEYGVGWNFNGNTRISFNIDSTNIYAWNVDSVTNSTNTGAFLMWETS
ncbi:MAG: hypothetical protein LBN03_00830 [Bifidobacteriaceae bacterium]|jgi:hypothetical protein|nr:hypothetical protein [Bifidobacteriaceae bacterium]